MLNALYKISLQTHKDIALGTAAKLTFFQALITHISICANCLLTVAAENRECVWVHRNLHLSNFSMIDKMTYFRCNFCCDSSPSFFRLWNNYIKIFRTLGKANTSLTVNFSCCQEWLSVYRHLKGTWNTAWKRVCDSPLRDHICPSLAQRPNNLLAQLFLC